MAISTDYPRPVQVNGFECRNCTDVDYAKKHIDPQDPKSGPYGVNAPKDEDAVKFGGSLTQVRQSEAAAASRDATRTSGAIFDIRA